ncbi:hypothetical protein M433DRAFT_77779, partial [Acidomyces richmondensis BFW]
MANVIVTREGTASTTFVLGPNNPGYCKESIPSIIRLGGDEYSRKGTVSKRKNGRKGISKVWQFGEALVRRSDKKEFYYCYDCEALKDSQPLLVLDGTSTARHHMRIKHYRDPDTGVIAVPKEPLKRDKQAVYTVVEAKQINVFKAYLIRWIVCCQLAFFMLENSVFRELIIWLNAALGALLPAARSTLRRWIIAEYEERKEVLKAELQASFSSIHISFDIWTAGN